MSCFKRKAGNAVIPKMDGRVSNHLIQMDKAFLVVSSLDGVVVSAIFFWHLRRFLGLRLL